MYYHSVVLFVAILSVATASFFSNAPLLASPAQQVEHHTSLREFYGLERIESREISEKRSLVPSADLKKIEGMWEGTQTYYPVNNKVCSKTKTVSQNTISIYGSSMNLTRVINGQIASLVMLTITSFTNGQLLVVDVSQSHYCFVWTDYAGGASVTADLASSTCPASGAAPVCNSQHVIISYSVTSSDLSAIQGTWEGSEYGYDTDKSGKCTKGSCSATVTIVNNILTVSECGTDEASVVIYSKKPTQVQTYVEFDGQAAPMCLNWFQSGESVSMSFDSMNPTACSANTEPACDNGIGLLTLQCKSGGCKKSGSSGSGSPSGKGLGIGSIIGIVVGVVAFIALAAGVGFMVYKRRQNSFQRHFNMTDDDFKN